MASTPVPGTAPGPNGAEGLLDNTARVVELTMTDEFGDAFVCDVTGRRTIIRHALVLAWGDEDCSRERGRA